MQFRISPLALAALSAICVCASARATIINQYSTLSSWQAATAASPLLNNFNSTTSGAVIGNGSLSYKFTNNAYNFTTPLVSILGYYNDTPSSPNAITLQVDASASVGSEFEYNSGALMAGGGYSSFGTGAYNTGLIADFNGATGIRSVSFNYSGLWYNSAGAAVFPTGNSLQLWVYEGTGPGLGTGTPLTPVQLSIPTNPTLGFFGFTTTGDIAGIRLVINTPTNMLEGKSILDNLSFGQIAGGGASADLPEPGTYLLCAAGLLGVAIGRRGRK